MSGAANKSARQQRGEHHGCQKILAQKTLILLVLFSAAFRHFSHGCEKHLHFRQGHLGYTSDAERFYDVLLERVGQMIKDGRSLDEIKQSVSIPEYKSWSGGKERLDTDVEAAYNAIKKY